jgi:hypothetical protein
MNEANGGQTPCAARLQSYRLFLDNRHEKAAAISSIDGWRDGGSRWPWA